MAAGADGVECDLQKSADGRYVIIHDPSTWVVSGVRGEVAGMSLADLQRLDLGGGERIPTLEELLSWLPAGAYLDLELKDDTITGSDCGPIADMLDARIDRARLMVSSFDPGLLLPFRRRGFTVGYLVGEETIARGAGDFAAMLLRLRPQYLNLPIQVGQALGARRAAFLYRFFRVCGFSLLFWTVNTLEDAAAVKGWARIIVTDEVELLAAGR